MLVMKDGVWQMPVHSAVSVDTQIRRVLSQYGDALFIAPPSGKISHGRITNTMDRG